MPYLIPRFLFTRKAMRRIDFKNALTAFQALCQSIFAGYTQAQPEDFVREKNLHEKRRKVLIAMQPFYKLAEPDQKNTVGLLETLYEVILSLGNLYYRISDHATFDVANRELVAISVCIKQNFAALKQKTPMSEGSLGQQIEQLEEVNHQALQVVTPDPLVFSLFLQDLKKLNELLQELAMK